MPHGNRLLLCLLPIFAIFALAFGTHLNQANAGLFKNRKAGCSGVAAAAACAPAAQAGCSGTRVSLKDRRAANRDARRASAGCSGVRMAACAPQAMSACAGAAVLVAPVEKERIPPPK